MAAKTRLSLDGYGAKRVGSFAGKEASEEPAAPEGLPKQQLFLVNVNRLMSH